MTPNDESLEARFGSLELASRELSLDVQALNRALLTVANLEKEQAKTRERLRASDQREKRTRRTFLIVAGALAVILPLVSILIYASLIDHVNHLLDEQALASYNGCVQRNLNTTTSIARERALADLETNPRAIKIHLDSATALTKNVVNCETTYQRNGK